MTDSRIKISPNAFTLLEMMVSLAVLVILITLAVQVGDAVFSEIDTQQRGFDTVSESQALFDRMATDLSSRIADTNIPAVMASANSSLAFASDVRGPASSALDHRYSVVTYCISGNTVTRGLKNILLSSAQPLQDSIDAVNGVVSADINDVMATNVVGFSICYLMKDGTITNSLPPNTPFGGTTTNTPSAVIVTVALLDTKTALMLSSRGIVYPSLSPSGPSTSLPLESWLATLNTSWVMGPLVAARDKVRFYQKTLRTE